MNVSCAIKTAKRSPLSRSTSGRSDTSENRRYELYSHLRIAISSGCTLRSTSGRFDTSKKEYPNTLLWLLGYPSRVDISSCTRSRGAQAYPWHTERGRFQRLGGMIADNHKKYHVSQFCAVIVERYGKRYRKRYNSTGFAPGAM